MNFLTTAYLMEKHGLRLDLEAALAQLPAEQRQPLLLVCVEQLSYAEVAEVLKSLGGRL